MEPAHTRSEDFVPLEVARLELAGGLVAAVVEDHRGPDPLAAVAVDCRHVRAAHPVVLEAPVEGLDAHRTNAFGDQVADRVVHHRGRDPGVEPEAVGQVGGDVEFTAARVNVAVARLAERDDPRVQAVDQGAEGQEVQRAILTNR